MTPPSILAAALVLAGCHRGADNPAAVSADEQRQLDEAATALDADTHGANASMPDGDAADNSTDDP